MSAHGLGAPAPVEAVRIVVRGHLGADWADWFDGLSMTPLGGGQCALEGALPDQAALFGLLLVVRDLGLALVSLERIAADHG